MARVNNVDALEKQLADLQMSKDQRSSTTKKIPPVVPPKKKAQPQVPHSAIVNKLREPSYSSKILPAAATDSTIYESNIHPLHRNYTNVQSSQPHPKPNYSNITFNQDEALPPPPPPLPLNISTLKYDHNDNAEYLPPSSPVSSNYSELARATANYQAKTNYPPIYQNEYAVAYNTPAYESLYEPINPRPQSSMSGHSNISTLPNYHHSLPNSNQPPLPKEAEVDALTNMLVQSISSSQEVDVFGVCIKCGDKVVGETSGCTAMGNMYHVTCFCCDHCNVNLQGKPFYAVDGQPYCEADYFETLEKCSVCDKPILDRILRATGKPYHPSCFTCVVCGKSLDGIPFTVDALNQIHCIEDFHKKFAPRCCVCELPIMPEEGAEETVRVVALDRSFHVRCYKCEDCGLLLSSEAEGRGCYPLDDHILCKTCNGHRIRLLTNVMTTDL